MSNYMTILEDYLGYLDEILIIRGNQLLSKIKNWHGLALPYLERMRPILKYIRFDDQSLNSQVLVNGLTCYLAILVQIKTDKAILETEHYDIGFDFVVLYISLDHYIDDSGVDYQTRKNTVSNLSQLIDLEELSSDSPYYLIWSSYQRLKRYNPKAVETLIQLYQAEAQSMELQTEKELSREEYFRIASNKGGLTSLAIAKLFSLRTEGAYELGQVVQLVDDLIDIDSDIADSISTIATATLKEDKFLDRLLIETIELISKIDSRYYVFQIALLETCTYCLSRHPSYYSRKLKSELSAFIHLRYDILGQPLSQKIDLALMDYLLQATLGD